MRLAELAKRLDCELRGDGSVEIERVAPIETAGAGDLTFVSNPRYKRWLARTAASAVILPLNAPEVSRPSLRTTEPYLAFARAIEEFHRPVRLEPGIHPTAVVAPTAEVGAGTSIGAFSVVGTGVRIGPGARIDAHVVIYPETTIGSGFVAYARVTVRERVRIGANVTLHSGVVIGSDGFGYVETAGGGVKKIVQAGNVVIEDDVEIGANTTVDRAAVGSTVIRRGAKIDNLVMIAHGCDVGEGSMLAAQVGLSGSTKVGRGVRIGGQAGLAGHLTVGDGAQIAAKSGVAKSLRAGAIVGGYPAAALPVWRRVSVSVLQLPELLRQVRRIERRLGIRREGSRTT